ncbi:hypothetical protein KY284_007652 [Solanum tuberosum]|nr:hypothetical protein KY284_007652 [Solanum tuberosum]
MTREEFEQLKVENYPVTLLNLPQNVEMSRMQGYQKGFSKGISVVFLLLFINKVLVPRTKMRTVASAVDLFHMEKLDELEDINKEVEIASLRSELHKAVSRGPGTSNGNEQVLQKLRDENERLLKTNTSPSEEVKALNRQLIKAYEDANECLSLFLRTPTPLPLPS